ncbi:Protein-tyrosine-phosphatase [[Candida] zeylanoides]
MSAVCASSTGSSKHSSPYSASPSQEQSPKFVPSITIDIGSMGALRGDAPAAAGIPSLLANPLQFSPSRSMGSKPLSPTYKLHFKNLPPEAVAIDAADIDNFVKACSPGSLAIIDIRPFNSFAASRLAGAVNVCVPSTLLKRPSYSLAQMLGSVDTRDQILDEHSDKYHNILIYDADSTNHQVSFSLYQTCVKLLNYDAKKFKVYYVNGGFARIDQHSNLVEHQRCDSIINSATSMVSDSSPVSSFASPTSPASFHRATTNDSSASCGAGGLSLSGFCLPSSAPAQQKFLSSIKRTNVPRLQTDFASSPQDPQPAFGWEPLYVCSRRSKPSDAQSMANYPYKFHYPERLRDSACAAKLPQWLQFIADIEQDESKSAKERNVELLTILNRKFSKIEISEEARLNTAIANAMSSRHSPSVCSPSALCPGCDEVEYKIPKGIEYGYKNRYKNIWPYEHSRVKLNFSSPTAARSPACTCNDQDDYFNANYIKFDEVSDYQYIATQNPLQATYEDFWKTIWYNKINVIVCLNRQLSANLAGQDSKYFDDHKFNTSKIETRHLETQDHGSFILRKLEVIKREVSFPVYQLEYRDWPDFGVPASFASMLKFIDFKNKLIKDHNLNSRLVVHCSAGCGRTGCFITLDMIMDCFKRHPQQGKLNPWDDDDLVYKTVQFQRKQRISMVQNLDQFIVCYEILLEYVANTLI